MVRGSQPSGDSRSTQAHVLTRVRRLWGRARARFPLTNLGVVVVAFSAVGWFVFGVPRSDYVIQQASVVAIGLVGLALVAVAIAAFVVHRAIARALDASDTAPISFEAKRGYASVLRMPAFRWFPLMELTWTWELPEGFDVRVDKNAGGLLETIEADERGKSDRIVRRFVIEDAFGLARVTLRRTQLRSIDVLPWSGRLVTAPMLRAHAGGEDISHPLGDPIGDRVEMRNYVPGDPLKLILWKTFARTGDLMVRTPERAVSPSLRIVAYLPSAFADEPAAGAARVAVESHLLGDGWLFSADGVNGSCSDVDTALEMIVASRNARGTDRGSAAGLETFLASEAESGRTRLVLFVPAVPGEWLGTVMNAVRGRDVPVTAIMCTDGIDGEVLAPGKMSKYLKRPEDVRASNHTTIEQMREVSESLANAGIHVVGVERPTGRMLNVASAHPSGSNLGRVA